MSDDRLTLTVDEAAELLGISRSLAPSYAPPSRRPSAPINQFCLTTASAIRQSLLPGPRTFGTRELLPIEKPAGCAGWPCELAGDVIERRPRRALSALVPLRP